MAESLDGFGVVTVTAAPGSADFGVRAQVDQSERAGRRVKEEPPAVDAVQERINHVDRSL